MDSPRGRENLPRPVAVKWLFRVGEVIGRWRIVRPLGHGRTGLVYLVAAPGQTAAVKVYCNLTPDESEDARQRELRVYRHPDLAVGALGTDDLDDLVAAEHGEDPAYARPVADDERLVVAGDLGERQRRAL